MEPASAGPRAKKARPASAHPAQCRCPKCHAGTLTTKQMHAATAAAALAAAAASGAAPGPPPEPLARSEWACRLKPEVQAQLQPHFGDERISRILKRLAIPPGVTTLRVNTLRTDRGALLAKLRSLGVLLSPLPARPLLPEAVELPTPPARSPLLGELVVSVDRVCGEAVLRGASIFAPGLKSLPRGVQVGSVVSVVVDIEGKDTRGQTTPCAGTHIYVGNGIARMDRSSILSAGKGLAVEMTEQIFAHPPLMGVLEDRYLLQNLPSIVAGRLLAPEAGERVLDMCAAPGGKTTHLAMMMQDRGELVACDRSAKKAAIIAAKAERFGITCVNAKKMDSRKLMLHDATQHAAANGHAVTDAATGRTRYPGEYFDKILLDPTCSALGLRPRFVQDNVSLVDLVGFASYQRVLLHHAVKLLKPGGVMVYSTCTWNPEENEGNVAYALAKFPLKLVAPEQHFGDPGMVVCGLSAEDAKLVQRFDPDSSDYDCIGFFAAKFVKTAPFADDFK